jgi:uncharacterized protein
MPHPTPGPREILTRYHQAMLDKSADDLADLYEPEARHEFPFRVPGWPAILGREKIRTHYRAAWGASGIRLAEIHDVVVHEADDPEVIFGEWSATGTIGDGDQPFTISGFLVLRVRDGLITHARDYMDVFGTYRAIGALDAVLELTRQEDSATAP